MDITLKDYKNKVLGCWMGKNIGGVLGAPFESIRGVFDISFFTQDLGGEPLPNDDIDLQLVWLNVAEKYGRSLNSQILGEYWLSYITPCWAEYGACKNNMKMGIVPPLSGYINNLYRNSNGAFIRSELWACLAPGHPDIAVKYAYEDAVVDHSNEGVYGEIFCAAVQSSAFVENDKYKLIDIGLSYIPSDCGVAKGILCVMESYKSKASWKDARKELLKKVPGSFGMLAGYQDREPEEDIPVGEMGYDAPSNVGIMILGWLYGEDDFGRSICIAAGCGEDGDCTTATLGATLGIISGGNKIPEKWFEPIGNRIKTLSINLADHDISVPETLDELTDRIVRLIPSFLGSKYVDCVNSQNGYTISMHSPDKLKNRPEKINGFVQSHFSDVIKRQPYAVKYDFTLFNAVFDYCGGPFIKEGLTKKFKIEIENHFLTQQWVTVKWYLPEGWQIAPLKIVGLSLEQYHCNIGKASLEFDLTPSVLECKSYDLVVEISSNGRHSKGFIPVTLISQ